MRLTAATQISREPGEPNSPAPEDSKLAVLLRKAQWLLDDAAYYLPQGTYDQRERDALASTLDQLAGLIREQPSARKAAPEQTQSQSPR
ncbi:hypothetical protein [Saccharopolyspora flava]|uniref:Uncharacterized protein n=1 Tax=Saccharopolyspora flava TaxID=95161 RepID=A0A1I6V7E5_9PSEU|nr:hypothetical protein [Saccharopolyspora flava]SFT09586.1 hypothetical protein SAMN05660874_05674 [Saccharopolyspora flava]